MNTYPTSLTPLNLDKVKDLSGLHACIDQLKDLQSKQEAELKINFTEFFESLNPVTIVKDSLHEMASDKEMQFNLVKVGITIGAELVTARLFGKHRSFSALIGETIVKNIVRYLINADNSASTQIDE